MDFEQRYRQEKQFHDKRAAGSAGADFYGLGALTRADHYAYELLGDLQGKLVLDLGCGTGHHAVKFAEKGARVYAIDLSPGMVERAKSRVKENGLDDRVKVIEMSAEELQFPDETFDLVFGHSILHHTTLELTRAQVHRVLKAGGKGVFLEPLGHNPLVNLFRKLTPHRRTTTEKPLKFEEVVFFAQPFSALRHHEFYLLALAAFALLPFKSSRAFQATLNWLSRLDDIIFASWSTSRRYAWVTVFEVIK